MAAGERARRRHRLIDLVRQGRRHAAHEVHARGPPRLRLHLLEPRLRLARGQVGALALADHHADQQAGHGEDQHDELELGEHARVISVLMQHGDEAQLRCGERRARAVDAVPQRGRQHRQKQQHEQLVVAWTRPPTTSHKMRPMAARYSNPSGTSEAMDFAVRSGQRRERRSRSGVTTAMPMTSPTRSGTEALGRSLIVNSSATSSSMLSSAAEAAAAAAPAASRSSTSRTWLSPISSRKQDQRSQ